MLIVECVLTVLHLLVSVFCIADDGAQPYVRKSRIQTWLWHCVKLVAICRPDLWWMLVEFLSMPEGQA